MKQAVMYGAGNIGRGFLGALFCQSGYAVTFIDVARPVIDALNEKHSYPLRLIKGDEREDLTVSGVSAVDGNDTASVAESIACCDIMATAVGVRVLDYIIPNVVAGIRRRWELGTGPLNIIICENLNEANLIVEAKIKALLSPSEIELFDRTVGLVEASIGRMVPVQTEAMRDGNPLRVCTERYGFLPVDKAAFKGDIPHIKGMVPYEPFDFYIKRKLFVHNMGHAITAYLGKMTGLGYISHSIENPYVRIIVQNAMLESARALSLRYKIDFDTLVDHISDLLSRFANTALKDTCARVGADPARKLSRSDRLVGPMLLAREEGLDASYITAGAAAAMWCYLGENDQIQSEENCRLHFCALSGLAGDDTLLDGLLTLYRVILDTRSVAELYRATEMLKEKTRTDVI